MSRDSPAATPQTASLTLAGLRVFVALEETGSVAAAAQRLGASSPGVSQQISALERAVGARLFDRRARPIALTPAGQLLSAHARRILAAVSEAQTELAEINLAALPELRLAIIDDLDASLTPVLVSNLQRRFPRCFVSALSGGSDQVVDRLVAREADIGVSAAVPRDAEAFRVLPLLRESFVLVAARGTLDGAGDIATRLEALPFVRYSDAVPIGRTVSSHLKRVRLNAARRFAFEATRSVLAMVAHAGGWTLTTPLNLLDAERFLPRVEVRPLPFAGLSRDVSLIARTGELGHLPEDLARDCRRIVRDHVAPRFAALAPGVAGAIAVAVD